MLFKIYRKLRIGPPGGYQDPGEGSSSSARTPQDKAQLRRAQVRKAQIQHRQRKANYVKQLEQDVAHIRDMITTEQHEVQILRDENDVMRTAMGIQSSSSGGSSLLPMGSSDIHPGVTPSPYGGSSSTTQDLDYISMSLALDDVMNRPAYRISGSSAASGSPSYYPTSSTSPDLDSLLGPSPSRGLPAAGTTTMPPPLPDMTSEQTQQAINFILALSLIRLEHVCWDHFRFTDFQPATNTPGTRFRASGHTMMATSLALRGAPEQVFESVGRTKANLLWSNRRANPVPEDMTTDWQASGLTLTSLYGLACSISDADLEITPVQAWFELAACWPMAVLLRGDVLDRLKKEFVGVVRCPHYGAQIERGAYESIVERVLGPEVDALLAEDVLKLDSARVDSGMGQQIGLAV
ncbi:BZIP-type transcription factor [Apodospora peruviana]|uniref:BZIP-type transcription factor n=1 Tax=Apodospora peruviana TaxID=516989 RepID=A0AAE0ME94_9PEZI|nr:BZIP-type transcription factor [Apodospora peruviana]